MKKILTILIIILLVFGAGVLWYLLNNPAGDKVPVVSFIKSNYFPTASSPSNNGANQNNSTGASSGETTSTKIPDENTATTQPEQVNTTAENALFQISQSPIAGAISFNNSGGAFIRFVDRATGHIFESSINPFFLKEISIKTIPKVYETLWNASNLPVLRYLDSGSGAIVTVEVTSITAGTTTADLATTSLYPDIRSLVSSPKNDKIFYLKSGFGTNGAEGLVRAKGKETTIFTSPLNEWALEWPKEDTIAMTTKPSSAVPGFLFFLNPSTGAQKRILENINGLVVLTNPTATEILYSQSFGSFVSAQFYNVKNGAVETEAPINTIPDKCVWSKINPEVIYCGIPKQIPLGQYPDSWYQGLVSFDDQLWRINLTTQTQKMLVDFSKAENKEFDLTNMFLSDKEDYIFFTNKKDSSLWGFKLPIDSVKVSS